MNALILTRRNVFRLLAAPAIIRVADMMPVRALAALSALVIPWGALLLRDGNGWTAVENGVMVPIAGRQLVRPNGALLSSEIQAELVNYDTLGTTMKLGPYVTIGHVQGDQYPIGGWQA